MKEIIQKYLEEQCKIDTYLAEKYKDTLIDGCIEYINKMAREELGGKNGAIKDEYWAHPKNLRERLDELRTQRENIRTLEEAEQLKKKKTRYNRVIKRFEGWDRTIDGYNIIIPKTVEQWQNQANVLNQCIIRMNYMDLVSKNHVLFFILNGDTPIATCEVTDLLEKKIGQFYADEYDRSNCMPTPEVRNAMLKYLDELKVS